MKIVERCQTYNVYEREGKFGWASLDNKHGAYPFSKSWEARADASETMLALGLRERDEDEDEY